MGTSVRRDQTSDQDRGQPVDTDIGRVSPGHFANLGIALVSGREFSRDDVRGAKVV
jgi:hypothetical protein